MTNGRSGRTANRVGGWQACSTHLIAGPRPPLFWTPLLATAAGWPTACAYDTTWCHISGADPASQQSLMLHHLQLCYICRQVLGRLQPEGRLVVFSVVLAVAVADSWGAWKVWRIWCLSSRSCVCSSVRYRLLTLLHLRQHTRPPCKKIQTQRHQDLHTAVPTGVRACVHTQTTAAQTTAVRCPQHTILGQMRGHRQDCMRQLSASTGGWTAVCRGQSVQLTQFEGDCSSRSWGNKND
jgi:hypothetical protein